MLQNSSIMKQIKFSYKSALLKTKVSSSSSIQFKFCSYPIVSVQSNC